MHLRKLEWLSCFTRACSFIRRAKQRVAIAGVVALRPDIIILDEATSMLDPEGREEVISTIKKIKEESQLTVISITHDIDEAANANRILVMRQGELVREGTPKEIFCWS